MQLHELVKQIQKEIDSTEFGPTVVVTTDGEHNVKKIIQNVPFSLISMALQIYLNKYMDRNMFDEKEVKESILNN